MQSVADLRQRLPSVADRRAAIAARNPVWRSETVDQALARLGADFRDRPYMLTDDVCWTYGDVLDRVETFARGLRTLGVKSGDRIALTMANHPIFVPLAFAAWRLGAILIPMNFAFRTQELGYVLEQSRCRMLITMTGFRGLDYLAMLDELAPGWEQDARGRFPELETIVLFGGSRAGVLTVEDLAARGAADKTVLPPNSAGATDPAVIMYTSGTTGAPKGVIQSHDALLRNAYCAAHHRAYEDGRRILFALPLYHAFALVKGILSPIWVGGAIIPQLVFDPVATFAAIERHRATDALFVPTMVMALIEHADAKNHDFSSMIAVLSGASPTPVRAWQQLINLFGLAEVVTGYGMTELAGATVMTRPGDPLTLVETTIGCTMDAGAAGIADLGGISGEYRTADPFTGALLPEGAEGELICRSPMATSGYFALPEQTAAMFLADGWLRSGDLGRVRRDGYIELTGRSKELYKSGGELVAPKEVEEVLISHPAVAQAYVCGLPDERWGEIGAAFVVFAPGMETTAAELIELCRRSLAKFKQPRHVFVITADDLPKTPTGKVQKFLLVQLGVQTLKAMACA